MGEELREADLCISWAPRPGWVVQGHQACFLPEVTLVVGAWSEGTPASGEEPALSSRSLMKRGRSPTWKPWSEMKQLLHL